MKREQYYFDPRIFYNRKKFGGPKRFWIPNNYLFHNLKKQERKAFNIGENFISGRTE